MISGAMWRRLFRPHYVRLFDETRRCGMDVIYHSCGNVMDIIPDLIDIGADVLQIDQPRLLGVDRLADEFGGKICFWNCVDIQWSVQAEVSLAEARDEAISMTRALGRFNGGFIARQYPQPNDIEMTPEKHSAIYEGFMESGCR